MHLGRSSSVNSLCVAFVAVAVIGTETSAHRGVSSEGSSRDPELTLCIRLTVVDDLPPRARARLTQEAEALWRREGVHLRWLSPEDRQPASGLVLRVLVGRLFGSAGEGDAWPVGKLLPGQSDDPIAIASITAAQQVLAAAGHEMEPSSLGQHRLGLVLGRALAHEIGHYLLDTRSHARYGLMRAQIDARDFADLREGGFFLDRVASRWIREVLAPGAASHHLLARFAY